MDSQKAKLQVLQDAMKLAPVISDAQSGNLISGVNYYPVFFTASAGFGSISGGLTGVFNGPVNGCYTSFLPAIVFTGDVVPAPANGRAVQRTPNVSHWFDTDKFAEPVGRQK